MHTIHAEHNSDSTELTIDSFDIAVRLELVLREEGYEVYSRHTDTAIIVVVIPKIYRTKLRKIIAEQFNPDIINVDKYE